MVRRAIFIILSIMILLVSGCTTTQEDITTGSAEVPYFETTQAPETLIRPPCLEEEEVSVTDSAEPVAEEPLPPASITIRNETGTTLTFLDIYTDEMMTSSELGYNLISSTPIQPGESINIILSEHPDIETAILNSAGALFHVQAENELQEIAFRNWEPEKDSMDILISRDNLYKSTLNGFLQVDTFRITNLTGYTITKLYILTTQMVLAYDFSQELLQGMEFPTDQNLDIHKNEVSYLEEFFAGDYQDEGLLIIAYDNEDDTLVKEWHPAEESWVIEFTSADYHDL